jgi:threonine dehydrogenase-like Zn-dependent dehydrogenase
VRAFVVTAPNRYAVEDVEPPTPGPGQVVVDVARVGVCGTDVEIFTGELPYLQQGHAWYPMRLGHEWCGRVSAVGEGVDPGWLGRRVTGDTMLGCGRCPRCLAGRHHVCEDRFEIGIRGGWPGALAEKLPVPAVALHALPDSVDATAGAMVEPGGNAVRVVDAAGVKPGSSVLVIGPGTIGLLVAQFALARGAEVHVLGIVPASLEFARELGVHGAWMADAPPARLFDAVIDASTAATAPARALELVEPGGRLVYIGISGAPSAIDSRAILLKDLTVTGILGASRGLPGAIAQYASGAVDPRPLVAATVGLDAVGEILAGARPPHAGRGPKIHVDPNRCLARVWPALAHRAQFVLGSRRA